MEREPDDLQLLTPQLTNQKKFYQTSAFKVSAVGIVLLLVVILAIVVPVTLLSSPKPNKQNVIIMVGDGFGPASATLARIAGEKENLPLDPYLVGTLRTYSSDSWITDSAAGATAYSCALKTYNGAIGVDPDQKPCGTLLEAAQKKGMKVGLVATSRVTHATPAAFASHAISREMEAFIGRQEVDHGVDVMFGGGKRYFVNQTNSELIPEAKAKGYQLVDTLEQFNGDLKMPVLGLFSTSHMNFEIDRDPLDQPSLAQMTQKAIDLLKDHNKGFFLMVEGSRIDMAAHDNDAAGQYHDTLAFNDAFQVALNFAKTNEDTLIVSVADHETGGLTLGRDYLFNNSYAEYNWHPELLRKVKKSAEFMASQIQSCADINQTLLEYAEIQVTDEEYTMICEENPTLKNAIGRVVSGRALVGWTTKGHTGVDINLYAYGKFSKELRIGNQQNIDIGKFIASKFGLNLEEITKELQNFNPTDEERSFTYDEYHSRF